MKTIQLVKQASAAALFGIAFAGSAMAAPVLTVLNSSVQGGGNTANVYAANYSANLPTGASFDVDPTVAFGSLDGVYKSPFNNTGLLATQSFFSVGATRNGSGAPSPVTLSFNSLQNSFSMLWGSIDGYNTISFLNGTTEIKNWTGSQILSLLPGSGERVAKLDFAFGNDVFNKVQFISGNPAFEFALAPSQVPEPGTLALLGLALGVASVVSRRRAS